MFRSGGIRERGNMFSKKSEVKIPWNQLDLKTKAHLANFCIENGLADNRISINGICGDIEPADVKKIVIRRKGKIVARTNNSFYKEVLLTEDGLKRICRVK